MIRTVRPRERGVWDAATALDLWNEYQRLGIVAVAGPFRGVKFEFDMPEAALTRRGRDILTRSGASPHDPGWYVAAALDALGDDEPVVRRFLVEAVDAFNGGLDLSVTAMLGFAFLMCSRSVATVQRSRPRLPARAHDAPIGPLTMLRILHIDYEASLTPFRAPNIIGRCLLRG